jgi:hypothetical protein
LLVANPMVIEKLLVANPRAKESFSLLILQWLKTFCC